MEESGKSTSTQNQKRSIELPVLNCAKCKTSTVHLEMKSKPKGCAERLCGLPAGHDHYDHYLCSLCGTERHWGGAVTACAYCSRDYQDEIVKAMRVNFMRVRLVLATP